MYPSFHYLCGCWGGCSLSQLTLDKRQSTPGMGLQFITLTYRDKQPYKLAFTPAGNFKSQTNLICMPLDCGRKPEHLEGGLAATGRACKLHRERHWPRIEP